MALGRTLDALVGELGEHILQWILALVGYADDGRLRLAAHFKVAKVEVGLRHIQLGRVDGRSAHGERVLQSVLVGKRYGAAEVACLGGLERHVEVAAGARCNRLEHLVELELVARAGHGAVVGVEAAALGGKRSIAGVGYLDAVG